MMESFIAYLWDLRTVTTFLVGMASGLVIAILMLSIPHKAPPPADDTREMVDLQGFFKRFGDDK